MRARTRAPAIDEFTVTPRERLGGDELAPGAEISEAEIPDPALESVPLRGAHLDGVRFSGLRAERVELATAGLFEVSFDGVDVVVLDGSRARWADVRVSGRLGALDLHESSLRSVRFVGCKLSFINLRGAELLDVAFVDCRIEELDLGGASARRVALDGCTLEKLDVSQARLTDVDLRRAEITELAGLVGLRGATIDSAQLMQFAPAFATHLGIRIED